MLFQETITQNSHALGIFEFHPQLAKFHDGVQILFDFLQLAHQLIVADAMLLQQGTNVFLVFLNVTDDSPSKIPCDVFGLVPFNLFPLIYLFSCPLIFNLYSLRFFRLFIQIAVGKHLVVEWTQS